MSTTAAKKTSFVGRSDSRGSSPARTAQRAATPTSTTGHARTRSVRGGGAPVSARAAASRRDTAMSAAESDARAETAAAVEDLQQRLEKEEKASEQYKKQAEVLQSKFDDATKESAKLEEKVHEYEEHMEALRNDKRDATRQVRDMETMHEAERSAMLKEKEELAKREEEMQAVIQRLKDSLAQRNAVDDDGRPSRQTASSSPSLDGGSFAPPSSLQRSDSRNSSRMIMQKDKVIEALRLELAEAQIKLVESENQGGGRLQEVERQLMETRMANARLMEDNESYQLLLQDKTLKGEFAHGDFGCLGTSANQDALNALEGKLGVSSLADELSDATAAEGESDRSPEMELKCAREQNKALTLYINKIIERLLQHQEFESILDQSSDMKPPPAADMNKELPAPPSETNGPTLLQRAKSMAVGTRPSVRPRPMSVMPTTNSAALSAHTDPDTAPSIPIGNLGRSTSTRRARPQSDQFTGAASLVSQMYRGGVVDGPASPTLGNNQRHSQVLFGPPSFSSARATSGSQAPSSSGNFPGMRSETSSLSGESGIDNSSTPPSQSSPPRSHSDKQTTFAGGKPRPLRLVQENPDAVKDNKRTSWLAGWPWGLKKDEAQPSTGHSIPE
ncbi:hypothetical protein CDD81_7347 [Ophiocordyceps australis]|uniref:M protein, serotype 2.1 n=1 Tax=Ophiocordyceps australis TaxID=1399860 RepID=A0A2C5Y472_9HYPO|nr:hypothetical protein CDD81_7347 [Ophiocordyceps australis]